MGSRRAWIVFSLFVISARPGNFLFAQAGSQSSSSSSTKHVKRPAVAIDSGIEAGTVSNGVYRNKTLGLSCRVPEGWVLRTEEMNTRDDTDSQAKSSPQRGTEENHGRVLLAAFSRPPEARGQDVNGSIVIAAENTSAYPGLTEAAQYFGPLSEVAKAQGLVAEEEPYEIAIGTKTLVREDFHKDVGSRMMRQSTLAMLSHGYAVSITVIAGTEDDVEELIDGLDFQGAAKVAPPPK